MSYEYIRGLIEGEGCFTFSTVGFRGEKKRKLPCFILGMRDRDEALISLVRDRLKLRNKVYTYPQRISGDGYNRGGMAMLIVRDFGQLKNIIVPLCYKKLRGNKGVQFIDWLEKIGADEAVPNPYKFIYKLHKSGFYESDTNFR